MLTDTSVEILHGRQAREIIRNSLLIEALLYSILQRITYLSREVISREKSYFNTNALVVSL